MYELLPPLKPPRTLSKEELERFKDDWNDLHKVPFSDSRIYRLVRVSPWWKFWDVQYEERGAAPPHAKRTKWRILDQMIEEHGDGET